MTDLVAPPWMDTKRGNVVEHWHSMVLHDGLIANVVVASEADGQWTARTQLRDRSFGLQGAGWKGAGFATHAAALRAGQAAALRLHHAMVGTRQVPELARTIALQQPAGGYRSRALRRFARSQHIAPSMPSPTTVPMRFPEAEMTA